MYTEQRPWGNFTILYETHNMKVKQITVHVGQRLSYQYHKRRQERWTIVEGE
jgi:mannose-1-phosphate guanylyltransferase